MLLAVEIGLTIWAWRRGWKWRALLPLGIGFPLAFIMGLMLRSSGVDVGTIGGIGIVGDIIVTIILIVMCVKKRTPKTTPKPTSEPTSGSTSDSKPS